MRSRQEYPAQGLSGALNKDPEEDLDDELAGASRQWSTKIIQKKAATI